MPHIGAIYRPDTSARAPVCNSNSNALGPYSRLFRARSPGKLDGRTTAGRFVRDAEAQLTAHVLRGRAGTLSTPQRLLIARLARIMLRLDLLDAKVAEGNATDFDLKMLGGLNSQFRLMLREIGLDDEPRRRKGDDFSHVARLMAQQAQPAKVPSIKRKDAAMSAAKASA